MTLKYLPLLGDESRLWALQVSRLSNAVVDPGGGSGRSVSPPPIRRFFETEILTSAGSYITF